MTSLHDRHINPLILKDLLPIALTLDWKRQRQLWTQVKLRLGGTAT